ncbi:MAG: HEAT repeat domain-containing protein [Planctomycetes bacterium]|nr:HEAT repeat domain-containing protein [Planctomycetota bacterium]
MDLKTVVLYLVVIAGSGLIAYAIFHDRKDESAREDQGGLIDRVEDPLWYRHADEETCLTALARRSRLLTSTAIPPEQAGPTKDDVALLCAFHESCARAFADHVLAQARLGAVELSAIMEIAARVRSPHFAALPPLGLDSPVWEVRYNAADAAITQGDPRAIPMLAQSLMEQSGIEILRVIDALTRIGGDEAYGTLAYGLQREDPDIRKALIVPLARAAYRPAIPDLRPVLEDGSPEVRMLAAWALMRMGQTEGRGLLIATCRDHDLPGPVRAQAANILGSEMIERPEVVALMRELLGDDEVAVAFEARLALATSGEEAVLAGLHADLDSDYADRRRLAIGILASCGRNEEIDRLAPRLPQMTIEEFAVFLNAAGRGLATGALEYIVEQARRKDRVGQLAMAAFRPFGDAALPHLRDLVLSLDDRILKLDALGAIGSIESAAARATLEGFDFGSEREYWRMQRTLIRRLDLALAKY